MQAYQLICETFKSCTSVSVLSHVGSVTVGGVWSGNLIYWTLRTPKDNYF